MRKFGLLATALSFLLLILGHWLNESLGLHAFFNLLVVFFLGQSLIIGWLIGLADARSAQTPMIILGIIGFRMITGLFLLLVFYFFKIPDLINLCMQFLVLYLVYMLFELSVLLTNLRPNSKDVKSS